MTSRPVETLSGTAKGESEPGRGHGRAPGSITQVHERPFALPNEVNERKIDHVCRLCELHFISPHRRHLYCERCSESRDLARKRLDGRKATTLRQRDRGRDTGIEISKEQCRPLSESIHHPDLEWQVRVRIPFSWSGSKNAIYTLRRKGHVALRREASSYRQALILTLQAALRGRKVIQNKLWIDIFVEKNNHKGDAVNFVDTVCDAVKIATDLDDRWFCIRNLDWSISKHEPNLIVAIGQEAVEHAQACSYCGRLLGLDRFASNKSNKFGKTRICKDCKRQSKPQKSESEIEYDGQKDFAGSLDEGYRAIRERVAAGGPGWDPKK